MEYAGVDFESCPYLYQFEDEELQEEEQGHVGYWLYKKNQSILLQCLGQLGLSVGILYTLPQKCHVILSCRMGLKVTLCIGTMTCPMHCLVEITKNTSNLHDSATNSTFDLLIIQNWPRST